MKYTVEIILLIVLVALMYYKDNLLTDMSKTQLGKLFLILLVVLLFITCNVNCAILGALVVIVIMHNSMSEGMENEDKEQEKADAAADIAAELTGGDEEKAEEEEEEKTGIEEEEEEEDADAAGAPIDDEAGPEEAFGVRENYESYTPRDLERVLHLSGESATLNSTAENL